MDYFPVFMNLQGRLALVVGGTEAAAQKCRLLLRAGARLRVVTTDPEPWMDDILGLPLVSLEARPLNEQHLDDVKIVIAASADEAENRYAYGMAERRGLPVNAVDRVDLCSFIMPAFVDRSPVMVAISSGGASPVLARLVRARIEAMLPQCLGVFAALASAFRDQVMRRIAPFQRRRFWEDALESDAADRAYAGEPERAAAILQHRIDAEACVAAADGGRPPCRNACRHPDRCSSRRHGEIWLVGVGSDDPDLLTNRASRMMQRCDVVFHDRLVSSAVLDRIRRDAEVIPVDERIAAGHQRETHVDQLMIKRARQGNRVLRLQCSDPTPLSQDGGERSCLLSAGIPVSIIPGVRAGSLTLPPAALAPRHQAPCRPPSPSTPTT